LYFVAENFDETLKVISVSVWATVDAPIHQDAEFGRRLFAFVEQLIETVKADENFNRKSKVFRTSMRSTAEVGPWRRKQSLLHAGFAHQLFLASGRIGIIPRRMLGWWKRTNAALKKSSQARVRRDSQAN
jgi:hypothetical protein